MLIFERLEQQKNRDFLTQTIDLIAIPKKNLRSRAKFFRITHTHSHSHSHSLKVLKKENDPFPYSHSLRIKGTDHQWMPQNRHSKPLTLGAVHAVHLWGKDVLLDCSLTLSNHSPCTCLYSVHLHVVPTTGWADLYEQSHLHPPFTTLVWRFPHQCVLDGLSIQQGLTAVAVSHDWHPSELCLSSLFHPNALFAWGVDTPGVVRLQLYVLLHRQSFSSTHRYQKKNRHAIIPGRRRNGYKCTGTHYKRLRRNL